ncbi:MAG TPA: nuclear transport factor 2 family protein [Gemmatimonadota bacterium]|nr:nuclear transport factor 2 family protein [Gemmatimonadota bacterium]
MRVRILALAALGCAAALRAPAPVAAQQDLTATLSGIEKTLWQAWKDHDPAPFQKYLADDALNVSQTGIEVGKAGYVASLADNGCDVKGFSFSDWAAHPVTDDVAILTYRATQDASCGGQAMPAAVIVSSVYVRKAGTWMSAAYHETPTRPSGL